MATSTTKGSERTFRGYTPEQAASYAALRGSYPVALYNYLIDHHRSTGGGTELVLDVGCGPGNATRDLAPHFDSAIGVDHGEGMVEMATKLGGATATGKPIEYLVSTAEDFDKLEQIKAASVDMLASSTAAHWFDMPKFWSAAANVVKPGGTVAIYTYARMFFHPSNPNADRLNDLIDRFYNDVLVQYMRPGNLVVQSGYRDLVLPWSPECSAAVGAAFDQSTFLRKEWDERGVPDDGKDFFGGTREGTLAIAEKLLLTGSALQRWRQANPDLVGTDKDCLRNLMEEIRSLLGVKSGEEDTFKIKAGASAVALLLKRTAL